MVWILRVIDHFKEQPQQLDRFTPNLIDIGVSHPTKRVFKKTSLLQLAFFTLDKYHKHVIQTCSKPPLVFHRKKKTTLDSQSHPLGFLSCPPWGNEILKKSPLDLRPNVPKSEGFEQNNHLSGNSANVTFFGMVSENVTRTQRLERWPPTKECGSTWYDKLSGPRKSYCPPRFNQ